MSEFDESLRICDEDEAMKNTNANMSFGNFFDKKSVEKRVAYVIKWDDKTLRKVDGKCH